jgi:hypothetical protein
VTPTGYAGPITRRSEQLLGEDMRSAVGPTTITVRDAQGRILDTITVSGSVGGFLTPA